MKLTEKSILLMLAVALTPLIVTGAIFYVQLRNTLATEVFSRLESIATIQQSRVEALHQYNLERLQNFTNRLQLRVTLDQYNRSPKVQDQAFIQRVLTESQQGLPAFRAITVLNPSGQVVASTHSDIVNTKRADWPIFQDGLVDNKVNEPFISPAGELRLYLAGPLKYGNRVVGVVVIESSGDDLLALTSDYTGLGRTGETLLARRRADQGALFLTPLRFDSYAALKTGISPELDSPMLKALLGHQTTFPQSVDYRGQEVLAAIRYVPSSEWGLVVKIDTSEAFAATTRLRDLLLLLVLVFSVLVVFLTLSATWRLTGQILAIEQAAHRLSHGNLSARVPVLSGDESGRVASSFNAMADDLQVLYRDLDSLVKQKTTHLQTIIDNLPVGVFVVKAPGGEPELFNPAGALLLGRPFDPKITKDQYTHAYNVIRADGTPYPVEELPLPITLQKGIPATKDDIFVIRPDGTRIPLRVSSVPIKDSNGKVTSALAVFTDRTIEKELAVERAKGDFVALASHQLRTPASGVKAFVSMLLDGYAGRITPKQAEFLRQAYDSNERALKVINDMLNVAMIESGDANSKTEPVNLNRLVDDIVAEQARVAEIRHQNLSLSKPAEPVVVSGDAGKLRMSLDNLVSNAIKYTPVGGKVDLSLKVASGKVTIAIKDSGVGIAPRDRKLLFKRFSRIDNPLSLETGAGSGLGLYIAHNIVTAHGGHITVVSRPGKGSTFSVILPYKTSSPVVLQRGRSAKRRAHG
jgi:signal transduction histidine kinase